MWFRSLPGSDGFGRVWSNSPSALPANGTPYLNTSSGDSLVFSFEDGSLFGVFAVDLAGYSKVVPEATIHFVGYRSDGSTVAADVERHGIQFQTYYFGSDWSSGLTRVEIPLPLWSLDNLVVSIPEPAVGAIFLTGALAFRLGRTGQRKT